MKKLFTVLLAVVLLVSATAVLTACAGVDATRDLERVLDKGVLRVGMECDYQPFNWEQSTDANGAVPIKNNQGKFANGLDVSIAKEVAKGLNVELEIYKLKWEALIPALQAGTIDVIIAGMSPTETRKETIDFSANYYVSNLVVVVRTDGEYANATTLAELAGAKIAAQKDTFHATALEQHVGGTVPANLLLNDFTRLIVALNAKTIDGYIAEEPGAIANCQSVEGFTYVPLINNQTGFSASDDDTALAVGLRKDSSLTAEVNKIVNKLTSEQVEQFVLDAVANQP